MALVRDRVIIGDDAPIGAGAVVPRTAIVALGQVWLGGLARPL
jgi:hypothetical protein